MFEYFDRLPTHVNHVYFKDMIAYFGEDLEKHEDDRLWERAWDITFWVLNRTPVFGVVRQGLHAQLWNTRMTLGVIPSLDDQIVGVYLDQTELTSV